jgi:elongation factor P--(R)-beta-lysine ligase
VPVVGRTAALDPNLQALSVYTAERHYLQTSPEYFLKRLLAEGSGSIYSLAHAFRGGEIGRLHNPEFALLEWYRVGFDMGQLIDDCLQLLGQFFPDAPIALNTYAELFQTHLGIDPHGCSADSIQSLVANKTSYQGALSATTGLELLFSQVIEPQLPAGIQVVTHYPADQAALAKIVEGGQGHQVALRFEIYLNGIELANGYEELTDADEQQQRFEREQQVRSAADQEVPEIDRKFLQALRKGLPPCSGVALGLDRLLMILVGADSISEVMTFPWQDL